MHARATELAHQVRTQASGPSLPASAFCCFTDGAAKAIAARQVIVFAALIARHVALQSPALAFARLARLIRVFGVWDLAIRAAACVDGQRRGDENATAEATRALQERRRERFRGGNGNAAEEATSTLQERRPDG